MVDPPHRLMAFSNGRRRRASAIMAHLGAEVTESLRHQHRRHVRRHLHARRHRPYALFNILKVEQTFLKWGGINAETCKGGPSSMPLGIWTPLPHTIQAESVMEEGIRQVKTRGDGRADK